VTNEGGVRVQHYPPNECGTVVGTEQVVTRSDHAALILRVAVAFSGGMRLEFTAMSRDERVPLDWVSEMTAVGAGIELAIGKPDQGEPELTPILIFQYGDNSERTLVSAGGGDQHYEIVLWFAPLPAAGELVLSGRWLNKQAVVGSVTLEIPTQSEVRERATMLWPPG
jgi:hypothetical protein